MSIDKLFKKETIGQSAGIVLFFTLLQRILQTGRGIVFARLLGPAEYGVYTLAFFFIPLAITFARLGIPSCFNRYIPQYEKKGTLRDFLKKTYLLILLGGAAISIICFLNARRLSGLIYGSVTHYRIMIICALTIFPYVIAEALESTFKGLRVFKLASVLKFSQFFIFTALGIALVIFYPKAELTLLANLFAFIIVGFFFSLIFRKYLTSLNSHGLNIDEDYFYRKIFKFSVFFIIAPVVYTMFNYTDRWMLSRLTNFSNVGIYSVAINISGLIFMFGMVAGNILMPNLSHIWEEGDKDKVMFMMNFAVKTNILFLLAGAMVLFLFKKQIVSVLYGTEYIKSLTVIGMLLVFWLFHAISWTVIGYAQLIEKTYIPLICGSVGLASNIFLNYFLIPRYGLLGAAVATTFSSGLILIMLYHWFRKEGLKVKGSTLLLCVAPLIFILGTIPAVFLFLVLAGFVVGSNFILSREEKNTLYCQVKKTITKFRKGKKTNEA